MLYLSTYEIRFSPNPLVVLLLCCRMYIPDLPWVHVDADADNNDNDNDDDNNDNADDNTL